MRKATIMIAVLVLCLLTFVFAECITAEAKVEQLTVEFSTYQTTVSVNQPVEFTANITNGTQPYTYRWETDLIPQELAKELGSPQNPNLPLAMILDGGVKKFQWPVTSSQIFHFCENVPGTYLVSVAVSDSNGVIVLGLPPSFIVVSTSPIPTPTPSPSPTSTPSPTPSPTLTPAPTPTPTITGSFTENNATLLGAILIVAVIAISAGLVVYFMKHNTKKVYN